MSPPRKDKYLNHVPPEWVPPLETILARADQSGGRDACWPWLGYHHLGRPLLYVRARRNVAVARLIGHHFRPLSRRETMLPQCGNRGCVNPSHLELCSVNSKSRLSEYEREEIVRLYRAGGASQSELAERYGVSQPAIHYTLSTRGGLATPRTRSKKANP